MTASVGIRELKQNASAVVATAAKGETLTITDRGRPVAQLSPLASGRLETLIAAGSARPPRRALGDLPPPVTTSGLSETLRSLRDEERY